MHLNPHLWSTLAVCLTLGMSPVAAQTVSSSFDELPQVLKRGQTVVVTDASGQQSRGKVGEVSPSSLVVLVPGRRIFTPASVTEIRVSDPLSNGALIGAAVGTGFAMWDYLIDPSEPGNAAVFAMAIGLGAAVGAGIDRLVNQGGTIVYVSPRPTRRVTISSVLARDRQGARVSVRF